MSPEQAAKTAVGPPVFYVPPMLVTLTKPVMIVLAMEAQLVVQMLERVVTRWAVLARLVRVRAHRRHSRISKGAEDEPRIAEFTESRSRVETFSHSVPFS